MVVMPSLRSRAVPGMFAVLAGAVAVALLVAGCSGDGAALDPSGESSASASTPSGTPSLTTPTPSASGTAQPTTWLCNPSMDRDDDPCTPGLSTTTYSPTWKKKGSSTPTATTGDDRPACFYVYPTVSEQGTDYSDLTIQDAQRNTASEQVGRYSGQCDVWAPMYHQLTLGGLYKLSQQGVNEMDSPQVFAPGVADVTVAFQEFLQQIGDRPFVVVAHSQGAMIMRQVLAATVDKDAAVRARMLSAILLGGNVLVAKGSTTGGDFQNIPACTAEGETGCVIAFSTYGESPPVGSVFGMTDQPGMEVLCTDPAELDGTGVASPMYVTWSIDDSQNVPGLPATKAIWQSVPGMYKARCLSGPDVLLLTSRKGSTPPQYNTDAPTWGSHDLDANLMLGNLIRLVRAQVAAYDG